MEAEYGFRSGAELGKIFNDMAHIPYHWYDDTPISFEEEAFLIPDDLLIVPLGALRTLFHTFTQLTTFTYTLPSSR